MNTREVFLEKNIESKYFDIKSQRKKYWKMIRLISLGRLAEGIFERLTNFFQTHELADLSKVFFTV
jgi:hypothetical protein